MTTIDYRYRASLHVDRAKDLLADQQSSEKLRYACLELRMAIEALTYERLEAYLAEVSNDVMKKWQPKQVLEELLFIDPTSESTTKLWVTPLDEAGVPSQPRKFLGTDERFTMKWAAKAHNTLGSFLHEPTIAQLEAGTESANKIRERAGEIVSELERVLSSHLTNVNLGVFHTIPCECGFTIKRKHEFVERGERVICASCGRIYDRVVDDKTGLFAFKLARANYECVQCKTEQGVDLHRLDKEPILVCCTCGAKAKVVRDYALVPMPVQSAAE